MAIKKSHPMRFTPKGLCDAFDSTDAFQGACTSLANLVFDQSNPEYVIPRPGVISLANLLALGYILPSFISVQVVIGNNVFGMVSSGLNPGNDQPFCVNLAGLVAIPITGITAANTPVSLATSGDWIPPTIASIGTYLIFTHNGFDGATHFFGALNLNTLAWTAGNFAVNPLSDRPTAVANFNNRAYFAFRGNQLGYSDSLDPLTRTNASQQLVIGDTNVIVALAGLPLQTTSSGVLQSLTIFKQSQVWQVTGDPVTADLSLNFLSLNIGTTMPRSIAMSPQGLYFGSNGGPYVIDAFGSIHQLSHSVQNPSPDINTPFQNASTPTRWAGAYTAGIYRLCGPVSVKGAVVVNDYWFDERRRRWSGPHSFAYDCASPMGNDFLLTSANNLGQLIDSPALPNSPNLAYNDLGSVFVCSLQSAAFPKAGDMAQKQVAESQIELGDAVTYKIAALDESLNTLGTVNITALGSGVPTWGGGGIWGDGGLWTAASPGPAKTYAVPWTVPLVFEKMSLSISATASAKLQIGTFMARYQETGYMTMRQGA